MNNYRTLEKKQNLSALEGTVLLFCYLEELAITIKLWQEQKSIVTFFKSIFFECKEKALLREKISKLQQNMQRTFLYISQMYLDVRSSGTIEHEKVNHNKKLVQKLYEEKVDIENVDSWRLLALGLLGDRTKPAHLLAPYIKDKMVAVQVEKAHKNFHEKIKLVERIKKNCLHEEEFFNSLYLRLRSLCVALEENGSQKARFDLLYTASS